MSTHADVVYLDLVKRVMDEGVFKPSRTGVDTISLFSAHYQLDLAAGFPLLTTKKMNWNAVLRELLWYLSGENHIRNLRQHTKIWDDWADADGNLDTAYGYYWRHFPSAEKDASGAWRVREIDQIRHVIDSLKKNPESRRLVVSAWEPGNAIRSKLPPCHYTFAFHAANGRLNCHLCQRSGDIALGIPFNMAAYAALTQMIAQEVGMLAGRFAHTIVDAHIYVAKPGAATQDHDHLEGLKQQLAREPYPLPKLMIAPKPFDELRFEDFELVGYRCHDPIRFKVAV
ncbi:Thymidylate synthase [Phycisphaerae bacterium RAS2]|nr:Thymidylate synthase [Phycisphaerae bacterium RAS2]